MLWSGELDVNSLVRELCLHRTASSDAAVPSQLPVPGHAVSSGVQSSWRPWFRDRAHPLFPAGVLDRQREHCRSADPSLPSDH